MKKLLLLLTIFFFYTSVFSQRRAIDITKENKLDFEYCITDYIPDSSTNSDSLLKFQKYSGSFFKYDISRLQKIILRSTFILNVNDSLQKYYLIVPPTEYVCNFYLNDYLLLQRGDKDEGYSNRIHYSSAIYLPQQFISYSNHNILIA